MTLASRLAKAERTFRTSQIRERNARISIMNDDELRSLVGEDTRIMVASTAQLEHLVCESDRLFFHGVSAAEMEKCCEKIVATWRGGR